MRWFGCVNAAVHSVDGNVCIQSTGFKLINYDGNLLDDFSTCCCSQSYTLFVVDGLEFHLADLAFFLLGGPGTLGNRGNDLPDRPPKGWSRTSAQVPLRTPQTKTGVDIVQERIAVPCCHRSTAMVKCWWVPEISRGFLRYLVLSCSKLLSLFWQVLPTCWCPLMPIQYQRDNSLPINIKIYIYL
jgi:hypothetical protein